MFDWVHIQCPYCKDGYAVTQTKKSECNLDVYKFDSNLDPTGYPPVDDPKKFDPKTFVDIIDDVKNDQLICNKCEKSFTVKHNLSRVELPSKYFHLD